MSADPRASAADRSRRPIVFLPAVQYHSLLGGRTRRLADEMARLGRQVTFVNFPALRATLARWRGRTVRPAEAGIRRVDLPPCPFGLLQHRLLGPPWVRHVRRRLLEQVPDLGESLVICSTPWWQPVLNGLPVGRLCYDCIDDVRVHAPGQRLETYTRWQSELLARADLVSVISEALRGDVLADGAPSRATFVLPNAVPDSWLAIGEVPASHRPAGPPVAGFLGALYEWVDIELLAAAAKALPQIEFCIIGPTRRGIDTTPLHELANVRLAGAQPYERVAECIRSFDVALIPFKRNHVCDVCDPLKLYEYLALGVPVVTTVPSAVAGDPPPAVYAETPDGFIDAIRSELANDSPHRRQSRREFAARHTWRRRAVDFLAAADTID